MIDPIVMAAMASLDNSVNRRFKLVHPLDKSSAVEILRILQHNGKFCGAEELAQYMIAEYQWSEEAAKKLRKLADDVHAGKKLHITRGRWTQRNYEIWETEASGHRSSPKD